VKAVSYLRCSVVRGVYTLLINLSESREITVGHLGTRCFPAGYYAYTGSALGKGSSGLLGRISRHLSTLKNVRWHIDYLLKARGVKIELIVVSESLKRMECMVVENLKEGSGATIVVEGLGASDCRAGCVSHLLYFPNASFEDVRCAVVNAFERVGLKTLNVQGR